MYCHMRNEAVCHIPLHEPPFLWRCWPRQSTSVLFWWILWLAQCRSERVLGLSPCLECWQKWGCCLTKFWTTLASTSNNWNIENQPPLNALTWFEVSGASRELKIGQKSWTIQILCIQRFVTCNVFLMNAINTPKISRLSPVAGCISKSNSWNESVLGVHALVSNRPTRTQIYHPEGKWCLRRWGPLRAKSRFSCPGKTCSKRHFELSNHLKLLDADSKGLQLLGSCEFLMSTCPKMRKQFLRLKESSRDMMQHDRNTASIMINRKCLVRWLESEN